MSAIHGTVRGVGPVWRPMPASAAVDDAVPAAPHAPDDAQEPHAVMPGGRADRIAPSGRRYRRAGGTARRGGDAERILDTDVDEKLDALQQRIAAAGADAGGDALLRDARRHFADDSDLLLALRELRRRRPAAAAALDAAAATLLRRGDARRIRAGIAAAPAAQAFGRRLHLDPRALRELYRQFVAFDGPHALLYENWIDRFGAARRKPLLRYVDAALRSDLQALDPGGGAVEFGPRYEMLQGVRRLAAADALFVARLRGDHGMPAEADALALLLGGLQRPFALDRVLAERGGALLRRLPARRQTVLLQRLYAAFAAVPTALYAEADQHDGGVARAAALGALRRLTDAALARRRGAAGTASGLAGRERPC